MPDQQIFITQNNTQKGCFSGCGTFVGVVLLIGLAVEYWYVSVGVAVIAAAVGLWYWRTHATRPEVSPPGHDEINAAAATCANCGTSTVGNFCSSCGAAQGRTCAGCGQRGLTSPYCPECGAATFVPPVPD
jgi:hypothetical protein